MAKTEMLAGVHAVQSALRNAPDGVRWVHFAQEARNARVTALRDQARAAGIEVQAVPRSVLDQTVDGLRHQDVVAGFVAENRYTERDLAALVESWSEPLLLVLDGVQDPHNLGACLRSADAAGANAVIIPKDKSSGITPTVRRAAAGAAEVVPIIEVANIARVLRSLKQAGIWLAGTSDAAEADLYQAELTGPLAWVIGGEGQGMRRLTADLCDFHYRIPMSGSVSSLNVSVATGICLFETIRQRSAKA